MQEQPEKDAEIQEEPLSSEAPDTLQPADETPSQLPDPTQSTESLQDEEIVAPDAAEPPAELSAEPPLEPAEQPDGEVAQEVDDLVADANAVDPKISVALLEAYLFSTHSPLTPGRLAELFNLESTKPIRKAIRVLNEQYEQTGRCFRVEQVAGGFQLLTLPEFGDHLKALHQKEADAKLTKAALETLAIIAYKQPILRADLEAIRGVASGETIRSLMEKHLVKIAGRAEEPGRPILYGTTKRFLEVFGLNTLKDLPQPDSPQAKSQQLAKAAQDLLAEPAGGETPASEIAESSPTDAPADAAQVPEAIAEEESASQTDFPAADQPPVDAPAPAGPAQDAASNESASAEPRPEDDSDSAEPKAD